MSETIPAEIGNLTKINYLNLDNNSLSGTIPAELGDIGSLSFIKLSYNSLSGTIPVEFGNLNTVIDLSLNNNNLTGTIPATLGDIQTVIFIDLSNNSLSGAVPLKFGNPLSNEYISLRNNLIDSLPSLNSIVSTIPIDIRNNKIGFSNIIHNLYSKSRENNDVPRGNKYRYNPQKLLDTRDTLFIELNNSIQLTVSDNHQDNSYQWYKDGDEITIATNRNYAITNFSYADIGNYWVEITNTTIKSLTLTRDTITLLDQLTGDSLAIITLYNATDGPNWKNKWDLNDNVKNWYGVTVTQGRVTSLSLENNNLTGTIPQKFHTLTNLQSLNLAGNYLDSISALTYLPDTTSIDISYNKLGFNSIVPNLID